MKIRTLLLAAIPVFATIQLVSCGDSPQPIEGSSQPAPAPAKSSEEARVSGSVVLEGAQFDAPKGTLWVSVRPKGMKAPWLSRKYPLENAQFTKTASGAKSLSFLLSSRDPAAETFNSSGSHTAPVECEVHACYKMGGTVDFPTLVEDTASFQSGKSDYLLTLKLP